MTVIAPIDRLNVFYHPAPHERVLVGQLAYRERRALFEYEAAFIERGLELSPFHLPAQPGVQFAEAIRLDGLFGLFDDSLPDGWGRLLLDRYMEKSGVQPATLTPLDRLAWVGPRAIGALSYEPTHEVEPSEDAIDLHHLSKEAQVVLHDRASDALPQLLRLGGSPQGARPKALVLLEDGGDQVLSGELERPGFTPYLVKFPARSDSPLYAGAVELAYSLMARAAGITMPPTRLLAAKGRNRGYFAIERFDWRGGARIHVHTASGLLHAPPGETFLSYDELLRLSWRLTRDIASVRELLRRAAFNVYAHNRDDHSRNFAFMMEADGRWLLAPAYDLSFAEGPRGEHTMTVAGEGRSPKRSHLEALGRAAGLTPQDVEEVLDAAVDAVAAWPKWADQAGVPKKMLRQIGARQSLG